MHEPERGDQDTKAVRQVFSAKRNVMIRRLEAMGVTFACKSTSTFYCWGCLKKLPAPLNDGHGFFRAALDRKVLTVPGEFFDVNPGKHRQGESPYRQWMRFSFGPSMHNMEMGLARLAEMVAKAR